MFRPLVLAGMAVITIAGSARAVPQVAIQIFDNNVLIGSTALTAGGSVYLSALDGGYSDPYFTNIQVISNGAPGAPDPFLGTNTFNVTTTSPPGGVFGTHVLVLMATQIGLSAPSVGSLLNTFTYNGLANPANITHAVGQNYVDAGNGAFALTTLIASSADSGGTASYNSGVISYSPVPAPLFSETEVYTMTFIGAAIGQSTVQIVGLVPEPFSLAVLGTGLLGLGLVRRRRAR